MTEPASRPPAPPDGGADRSARRGSERLARRAAGDMAVVLRVRALISLGGVIAAVVGAVLLFARSRTTAEFGPFLADSGTVTVTAYSGSWIVGAGGLALLAGLLLVAVVADGYRSIRVRRLSRPLR